MRRAYVYKPSSITAPIFVFQTRLASAVLPWSAAQTAAWNLQIARTSVTALQARYLSACAALGRANRLKSPLRRRWQAEAFRSINATRKQLRAADAAFAAALANPVLASDQVPA